MSSLELWDHHHKAISQSLGIWNPSTFPIKSLKLHIPQRLQQLGPHNLKCTLYLLISSIFSYPSLRFYISPINIDHKTLYGYHSILLCYQHCLSVLNVNLEILLLSFISSPFSFIPFQPADNHCLVVISTYQFQKCTLAPLSLYNLGQVLSFLVRVHNLSIFL